MAEVKRHINERLQQAFDSLSPGADPVLRSSDRADLQANGALPLAKALGRPPRQVAEQVVEAAQLADLCDKVEVSGPGFINLRLSDAFIARRVAEMAGDERLGVGRVAASRRVVVDYSAPNVAKEMHVGHLRTTLIGDALCRLLEFLGHDVIRRNHIGDWGTPFGMLIEHLVDVGEEAGAHELSVGDLGGFYAQARASFDRDEQFRERSRRRVVLLQSGDPETQRLWRVLVAESVRYFDDVYGRLGVLLTDDDIVGESFYSSALPSMLEELEAKGLLVEHEGALCVFPPGFANRSGDPLPLIVQKSDGGFSYAATDLAAMRDRVTNLGASLVLYVVGAAQAQHLAMVFAVAEMAGWLPQGTEAVHVSFGHVLGSDHKLMRSRAGGGTRLVDLIDGAVLRGKQAVASRDPELDEQSLERLGRQLGVGALKYADLSTERNRDYVFDWDRMLAFEGNTGPYLQYAHARIASIFRRGTQDGLAGLYEGPSTASGPWPGPRPGPRPGSLPCMPPLLHEPEERELAKELVMFDEAVEAAADTTSPSRLTGYLYDLATVFTTFYEHCPVLRAPDPEVGRSRLVLCRATSEVLACGLGLLGIAAPERM